MLLLLHGERLIENQFLSTYLQHIFPYCTKSVCFSCLQICNIWNWCWKHLVLNIPPQKEVKGGWYPAIVVARVSDHLSHSTCLEMLQPKTDERVNPSVEVHRFVGKLSTAETLLTEVCVCMPRSFLVINVCNRGKTLCSPCTSTSHILSWLVRE